MVASLKPDLLKIFISHSTGDLVLVRHKLS